MATYLELMEAILAPPRQRFDMNRALMAVFRYGRKFTLYCGNRAWLTCRAAPEEGRGLALMRFLVNTGASIELYDEIGGGDRSTWRHSWVKKFTRGEEFLDDGSGIREALEKVLEKIMPRAVNVKMTIEER